MSALVPAWRVAAAYKEGVLSEELTNRLYAAGKKKLAKVIPPSVGNLPISEFEKRYKNPKRRRMVKATRRRRYVYNPYRKRTQSIPRPLPPSLSQGRHGVDGDTTTGTMQSGTLYFDRICDISKSVDYGGRIGNKVFCRGVRLRMAFYNSNTSSIDCGRVRMFCLQNKKPTTDFGVELWAPTGDTMTPLDYSATPDFFNMVKPINLRKNKVLFDKVYPLPIRATGEAGPKTTLINVYIRINRWFTYNTEAAAIDRILPAIAVCWIVERDTQTAGNFTAPIDYKKQIQTDFYQ